MKIYIAGPMRGLPNLNFEAFDEARNIWKSAGHQPFSPAEMDRALGYTGEQSECALRHLILGDIIAIYNAEAIAVLPGWERSKGATLEVALAHVLGLPVYDALTMEKIEPMLCPWQSLPKPPGVPVYGQGDVIYKQITRMPHNNQSYAGWTINEHTLAQLENFKSKGYRIWIQFCNANGEVVHDCSLDKCRVSAKRSNYYFITPE